MLQFPLEDAHGAGHYYYLVIIRNSSEQFRFQLGFAANGQLLAQTYRHLDCDTLLDKYPIHLGRWSKQVKVICQSSQHVGLAGLELTTFCL